jgi:hypothetical protein
MVRRRHPLHHLLLLLWALLLLVGVQVLLSAPLTLSLPNQYPPTSPLQKRPHPHLLLLVCCHWSYW